MKAVSFIKKEIEAYSNYRAVSGRKSNSYLKSIMLFDRFCAREYPAATELTQEMVDRWCAQRDTETTNSCISRIYGVISLIRHMQTHGGCGVSTPPIPKSVKRTYVPHAFSGAELRRFFNACDTIKHRKGLCHAIQSVTLPVFFRLLYSSGIRTTEAIALKARDVNLNTGVITIREGKGYGEHLIVLHDTMLDLMRMYDRRIESLMPSRRVFFPTHDDREHSPAWVTYHFRVLWGKCNDTHATPYELRHNYAAENINSWQGVGYGLHDKLLALSKSMGHKDMRSTMGYYHLTPSLADSVRLADDGFYETLINWEDL